MIWFRALRAFTADVLHAFADYVDTKYANACNDPEEGQ